MLTHRVFSCLLAAALGAVPPAVLPAGPPSLPFLLPRRDVVSKRIGSRVSTGVASATAGVRLAGSSGLRGADAKLMEAASQFYESEVLRLHQSANDDEPSSHPAHWGHLAKTKHSFSSLVGYWESILGLFMVAGFAAVVAVSWSWQTSAPKVLAVQTEMTCHDVLFIAGQGRLALAALTSEQSYATRPVAFTDGLYTSWGGRTAGLAVTKSAAAATTKDAPTQAGGRRAPRRRGSSSKSAKFAKRQKPSKPGGAKRPPVTGKFQTVRRSKPPTFKPEAQLGAVAPLGFFDPLGFAKVGDEEGFRKLRAAELKHGRLAMIASIGLVVQHFVRIPGLESLPAGFNALLTAPGALAVGALVYPSTIIEINWKERADREPGNFGDPLGVNMYTDDMRLKEISNGRMAMISVVGICAAEVATGKDAIQQLGF